MNIFDESYILKDGSEHKGLIELVRYLVKKEVEKPEGKMSEEKERYEIGLNLYNEWVEDVTDGKDFREWIEDKVNPVKPIDPMREAWDQYEKAIINEHYPDLAKFETFKIELKDFLNPNKKIDEAIENVQELLRMKCPSYSNDVGVNFREILEEIKNKPLA